MQQLTLDGTCPSGESLKIETDSVEMATSLVEYLMGAIRPEAFLAYMETLQPDALPVAKLAVQLCQPLVAAAGAGG